MRLTIANQKYRAERMLRWRIAEAVANLELDKLCLVCVTNRGLQSHGYSLTPKAFASWVEQGKQGDQVDLLFPMVPIKAPWRVLAQFRNPREDVDWIFSPRLVSFFGSTSGKFKYSLGAIAGVEGMLNEVIFYRILSSYALTSSVQRLTIRDRNNPSQLLHVRTDAVKYYQEGRARLEEAFVQRVWNFPHGLFARCAVGYFEPAYFGVACEALSFPLGSRWSLGFEGALVKKRCYSGLGTTGSISRFDGTVLVFERFLGVQALMRTYFQVTPHFLFQIDLGRFLARDLGAKLQCFRLFPNGVRLGLWLTLTNGHDHVNGTTCFDKGFCLDIPVDLFRKKRSLSTMKYAMSAWLRDVGASARTGEELFPLLHAVRSDQSDPALHGK